MEYMVVPCNNVHQEPGGCFRTFGGELDPTERRAGLGGAFFLEEDEESKKKKKEKKKSCLLRQTENSHCDHGANL